jgi:hypothetical protein
MKLLTIFSFPSHVVAEHPKKFNTLFWLSMFSLLIFSLIYFHDEIYQQYTRFMFQFGGGEIK